MEEVDGSASSVVNMKKNPFGGEIDLRLVWVNKFWVEMNVKGLNNKLAPDG